MEFQHLIDILLAIILPSAGWYINRLASKVEDMSERIVRSESRLESMGEVTRAIQQVREDVSFMKATVEQLVLRMDAKR